MCCRKRDGRTVGTGRLVGIELGQPKVENFEAAIFGDEYVFRLEVAVNDSGVVCGCKSVCQTHAEVEDFGQSHGAVVQAVTQGFAFAAIR